MKIRPAVPADAAGIGLAHVRSGQAAFAGILPADHLDALDPRQHHLTWEKLLGELRRPTADVLVAEKFEEIVGFACYVPTEDPDGDPRITGELSTLYTLPQVWGTGVGRALMSRTMTGLRDAGYADATLWVLADNERARKFYEAAGWHTDDGSVPADPADPHSPVKLRYRIPVRQRFAPDGDNTAATNDIGGRSPRLQ